MVDVVIKKNELKQLLGEHPALAKLVQTAVCAEERTTILKCHRSARMRKFDGHEDVDWWNHDCFFCAVQVCKRTPSCNCWLCTRVAEWRERLEAICGNDTFHTKKKASPRVLAAHAAEKNTR